MFLGKFAQFSEIFAHDRRGYATPQHLKAGSLLKFYFGKHPWCCNLDILAPRSSLATPSVPHPRFAQSRSSSLLPRNFCFSFRAYFFIQICCFCSFFTPLTPKHLNTKDKINTKNNQETNKINMKKLILNNIKICIYQICQVNPIINCVLAFLEIYPFWNIYIYIFQFLYTI